MRFTEWLEKMDSQQKRLNDLALSEVSETIGVNGKTIVFTFGKGKRHCEVDGSACEPRFLRPLYTNNKEEFDAMLESVTEQTDQVVEATATILESVSEEGIPQAVIARMRGDKISGDPADMVEAMADKKLSELSGIIHKAAPYGVLTSFEADLGEIAERPLSVKCSPIASIFWGKLHIQGNAVEIPDAEEAMYFLANYEFIKARVLGFFDQVKRIS